MLLFQTYRTFRVASLTGGVDSKEDQRDLGEVTPTTASPRARTQ